ncbi:hypothetical protein CDAR_435831 [Caerostris darwini]|uniref:Uncharacterized protein n=1 Tax=Caerostris darwini TaxID=1538125 RepID=A0AAV4PNK5_9ARAC|nr:hypothetical protein CDAR_435831 [Caerostris darwini]
MRPSNNFQYTRRYPPSTHTGIVCYKRKLFLEKNTHAALLTTRSLLPNPSSLPVRSAVIKLTGSKGHPLPVKNCDTVPFDTLIY